MTISLAVSPAEGETVNRSPWGPVSPIGNPRPRLYLQMAEAGNPRPAPVANPNTNRSCTKIEYTMVS